MAIADQIAGITEASLRLGSGIGKAADRDLRQLTLPPENAERIGPAP
jgi:hypothetical protein